MAPSVSIITPCYNAAHTLPGSVESILSQVYTDWELLLVDDCSTDGTADVIREFRARDPRIRCLNLPRNGGAAKARNLGIEHARGRYIAFLDADDLWRPEKLERQIGLMRTHQWPISFTAYQKVRADGSPLSIIGVPEKVDYRGLLKTNYIGCSTAVYDSRKLGKVLMPDIRKRQDFGLWLRLLKQTSHAYGINEPYTLYRVQGDSLSANKSRTVGYNWHLYRKVEQLPLLQSLYYFFQYASRGLLRSKAPRLARWLGWLS